MKKGWEYRSFKDVFPIKMGKTPSRGDSSSWDKTKVTSNRWVSIADISINEGKIIDDTKEYITDKAAEKINLVKAGSLLMSFKLSIGRMAFAGVDLYTNEAIIAIPKNEDYDLKFLYYYLLQYDWRTLTEGNEKVKGATLNKQSIGKIKLPVISSAEQRRIVSYLDSSFDLIDKIKENASKSLSEAKALFQAALAEAMEPKEGWEENTLGEIGSFKRGGNFTKRDFIEDGFPCVHYGQIHMKFGHVTKQHLSCVPENFVKKDRCAKKGDLIIAITSEDDEGSCKCTAWMANYEVYVGGHTAIYTHNLDPIFMSYYFQSPRFQKAKLEYTHGFKVVEINPKDIAKITIIYLPLPTQKQIVSRLDSLSSKVRAIEEKYQKMIAECDALKQAMMREVFE